MKCFKIILSIIMVLIIGSTNPMGNNSNNLPPQRPMVSAPKKPMTSSPQRPLSPAPQTRMLPITNQTIPHNEQFNTNPPERTLPAIPSTQKTLPTPPSKKNTASSYSTQPTQRSLPTVPSIQNKISTKLQPTDLEPTNTSSSTQPKQPNTNEPQTSKYDEILYIITTDMDPQYILVNNTFTDNFLDFVSAQDLSDKDAAALLETVATLYMTPTTNETKNKQISLPAQKNNVSDKKTPIHINQKMPALKKSYEENIIRQKHFVTHNLIMLLDPTKTETLTGNARLAVQDAIVGLYEQTAPIIMSSNILEIITTLRYTIGKDNLQKLRNSSYNQANSLIQQLLKQHNLHENSSLVILLSLIDFDSKNFIFYFHTSEDLVLIIPQQYVTENIEDAYKLTFQEQAKQCGFNTVALIPIDNLDADNLLVQLKIQQTSEHKDTFINNLTALFIPQKKHGELITPTENVPWNIYLGGHGGAFYQSIGSIREQLDVNKHNLNFYREELHNNKKKHDAQKNIPLTEAKIKKYEKMLQGKSDWPDSQLLVGQGSITGITMDEFSTLIKFFNQNLNVYFLHYTSCLDGGYKQTFVNELLSSLDVDFIVSTQGLDERTTQGIKFELQFSSQPPYITVLKKPFSAFFKILKTFIDRPEKFVTVKKYKKEPFSYVLEAIVPNMTPQNQPFIRFPGAGIFGALSLGKNTKNITNVILKAREIENKPIDLSDKDINTVIIAPSRINIPLNFGNNTNCSIVSPTPATINASHEAIHMFKEINFENSLQSLIFNFISFNARIHTQTFVIKQLHSSNKTIHNLIIQIKNIPDQTMQARLEIAFEFNNNMYQCATIINDFEDPNLAKLIYSLNFTPTTDIQPLSHKFLTPQEVKKLKQPISLQKIIEAIDAQIDKQQPSLKNTAVKKELVDFVKEIPNK